MEEDKEALQQFFKDWSATAEQTVREIRSFAENYYSFVQKMLVPLPWLADFNKRLGDYVKQDFDATVECVQQVSQASDIQDLTRIYLAYIQKCMELVITHSRDFAGTYFRRSA